MPSCRASIRSRFFPERRSRHQRHRILSDAPSSPDSGSSALARLARSERRLRALIEASTDVVWFTDATGMVRDMPGWRNLTGQTADEVRGQGWLDAIHPEDRERVTHTWWTAHDQRTLYEAEYRLRMRDGRYRWFRARGAPILDDTGAVEEWIGVFDDVHDERTLTERLALLAAAGAELASSLDYQETLQHVVDLAIPTFADWCFLEMREPNGSIRPLAIAHRDPAKVALAWDYLRRWPIDPNAPYGTPQIIRSGRAELSPGFPEEALDALAPDPEQRRILREVGLGSHVAAPLVVRGTIIGVLSFVMAESGRSYGGDDLEFAVELARRAALAIENARLFAEAQRANQAKAEFLAVMSHELRTPLNAIAGYTELLELGLRGPITDAQRADLVRIRRSQQHLLGLITDILTFSRIEAGQAVVRLEPVSVQEVLFAVSAMIEPQAAARRLRFEMPRVDPVLRVRADAERLRQVLLNLLSNAVKFTAPGGEVRVACAVHDARVSLHVSDTGIGIPVENQDAIFAPFVQLDRSLTRTTEGTGLGLAISRDLAHLMGATLTVDSTPRVGSTFTLTLQRG